MLDPVFIVIVVAVLGLVVVAFVVNRHYEKKRTERLSSVARELGFEFEPDASAVLASGAGQLPLFSRGHSKKAQNGLRKTVRGTEITLLDYQFTIGHGKGAHTHRQTVALFRGDSQTTFPDFEVKPENFFHKIGAMFGYQDIDFDTHPQFSKKYLVRGTDEPAVRGTFTTNVLDFLQSSGIQWSIESRANWMAIYYAKRAAPEELREFLSDTTRIFLLFAPKSDVAAEN